jgi:hypothetical protein
MREQPGSRLEYEATGILCPNSISCNSVLDTFDCSIESYTRITMGQSEPGPRFALGSR